MVEAPDRLAGERGPSLGRRVPELCSIDRAARVVEPRTTGATGDEHRAIRQQRRVQMAPRIRHRRDGPPGRWRTVQVDYFGSGGRRVAAADEQDLSRVVQNGGSVITIACGTVRDERPVAGTGCVEISRRAARTAVEHESVGSEMHPRIKVERE